MQVHGQERGPLALLAMGTIHAAAIVPNADATGRILDFDVQNKWRRQGRDADLAGPAPAEKLK